MTDTHQISDARSREFIESIPDLKQRFWEDGYIMLRGAFTPQEMAILREAIQRCGQMNERFVEVQKKYHSGKYPSFETIFVMDDVFGDNIFSKVTRRYQIIDTISYLFDDDAYVYHNKVTLKYPDMPGFKFHQDYFYWYQMGCLLPHMATCFVAVDPATRDNGCLKLMRGTHRLGRIDHELYDGFSDSEVEPRRLAVIKERFEEDYMEMNPGDALIFHCNTLHGSDANSSDQSRLALLGCFNTRRNDPFDKSWSHPSYAPQKRVFDPLEIRDIINLPDFTVNFAETD